MIIWSLFQDFSANELHEGSFEKEFAELAIEVDLIIATIDEVHYSLWCYEDPVIRVNISDSLAY